MGRRFLIVFFFISLIKVIKKQIIFFKYILWQLFIFKIYFFISIYILLEKKKGYREISSSIFPIFKNIPLLEIFWPL